jgi:RNA polymerase primary sigma factor
MGQAERALAAPGAGSARGVPSSAISAATLELARRAQHTLSLDRSLGDEEDGDRGAAVADDTTPSPFEMTANTLLRERLVDLLQALPERERAIVSLRYGLVDGRAYSCAEVGARIHLTRERVRQLEVLALRTMRAAPEGAALAGYLP